jgi:hypothetical protein
VKFLDKVSAFVEENWLPLVETIIIGPWDKENGTIHPAKNLRKCIKLLSQNETLQNVTSLMIGDIPVNTKLSWIELCEVTTLVSSLPNLQHLKIKGSSGLAFAPITHGELISLTIECVELPSKVLQGICKSNFPNLQRLELWLGSQDQEGSWQTSDLVSLVTCNKVTKLTYLGGFADHRTCAEISEVEGVSFKEHSTYERIGRRDSRQRFNRATGSS